MSRRRFGDFFAELNQERAIAYYPRLVRVAGSVNAAILLGQLTYWTPRARDPEGWIYKTQAELEDETGLGRWEQETARKLLKASGILHEKRAGVPARLFFKIDHDALSRTWEEIYPEAIEDQDEVSPHPRMRDSHIQGLTSGNASRSRMRQNHKQGRGKTADKSVAAPQSFKESKTSSATTSTTPGGGGKVDEEKLAADLPGLMRADGISEDVIDKAVTEALSALRAAVADGRVSKGPVSYCLGVARRVQREHERSLGSVEASQRVEQRRLELEAVCPHGAAWASCASCQEEAQVGERLRARLNKADGEAVA